MRRVNPDARLQVVEPCAHGEYTTHGLEFGACDGPLFTMTLEYDNPLAMVEVSVEDVIYQAYAALGEEE